MVASGYDLSAVVAHGAAAHEQHCKGRYGRAAEKWGRAVEAARALDAPDCIVLAYAQLHQAEDLLGQIFKSGGANVAEDARFMPAMDLVPSAADVLERRRIAGTLLYGKCAPHEVQWWRKLLETRGCDVAELGAPFVGYEAYLTATRLTLYRCSTLCKNWPLTEPVPLTCMSVVASALDLMCEPRPHEHIVLAVDALLVEQVRRCCLDLSWLNHIYREELLAAWGRLQASGVIERLQLEWVSQENDCEVKKAYAKAQADAVARGLHSCAHCGAQEMHVAQFKRCAACKGALYCSKECQNAAWPAHKAACKAALKAAAAAAANA